MIYIANPIYDVVFKYLLEDKVSAKILLSNILEVPILELDLRPQEHVLELENRSLTVYRLDFSAKIETSPGVYKLVIIEIQKAKLVTDLMRFRRYLGLHYANRDHVYRDHKDEERALPIVTIYFLGYGLEHIEAPVVQVKRSYLDSRTRTRLEVVEPFIESLTHDSYIVQIGRLKEPYQSELERLLSIFDQHRLAGDGHSIVFNETNYPQAYRPLMDRLVRAGAEQEMRSHMDVEDDIVEALAHLERKIDKKELKIEAQEKVIEAKDQALQEQGKVLEEKDQALQVQGKVLEEKDQALEEQGKTLEEQGKTLEEQAQALRDQANLIAELQKALLLAK